MQSQFYRANISAGFFPFYLSLALLPLCINRIIKAAFMLHLRNKGSGLFVAQTVQRRIHKESDLSQVRLVKVVKILLLQ